MPILQQPVRHCSNSHTAFECVVFAAILATCGLGAGTCQASDEEHAAATVVETVADSILSTEELYDRVASSVVTIRISDERNAPIGDGLGVFVDESLVDRRHDRPESDAGFIKYFQSKLDFKSAYVLTTHQFIQSAVIASIALADGEFGVVWDVVAENEELDLALLWVMVPSHLPANGIPLANNDPIVEAPVYAICNSVTHPCDIRSGTISSYRDLEGNVRRLLTTIAFDPELFAAPLLQADGTLTGLATIRSADSDGLSSAVPVSNVREFLSTGKFAVRKTWEGASIWIEEPWVIAQLEFAATSSIYSADEQRAIAALQKAGSTVDSDQVILLLRKVDDSLPDEFEYLAHYFAGKAGVSAAIPADWEDATDSSRNEEQQLQYRRSEHAKAAHDHLCKAIELNPYFSPAYERLYQHYRLSGNWTAAFRTTDNLVRLMPRSADALALRAECYRVLDQVDAARNDLEAAIELLSSDGQIHYQLAKTHSELGDYGRAIDSYINALESAPPTLHKEVHYHLGLAFRNDGNPVKAISEFRTAKALGWPAESCDEQIAECQLRVDPMATTANTHTK